MAKPTGGPSYLREHSLGLAILEERFDCRRSATTPTIGACGRTEGRGGWLSGYGLEVLEGGDLLPACGGRGAGRHLYEVLRGGGLLEGGCSACEKDLVRKSSLQLMAYRAEV